MVKRRTEDASRYRRRLGGKVGGENLSRTAFLNSEQCEVSLLWCVGLEQREVEITDTYQRQGDLWEEVAIATVTIIRCGGGEGRMT